MRVKFLQAVHRRPGQRRIHQRDAFGIDACVHRLPLLAKGAGSAAFVAGCAVARVLRANPRLGFGVAAGLLIHSEHQHRGAGVLRALHQLFGGIPARGGVELEPDRFPVSLVDVLDGHAGLRGQDHLRLLGPGGARCPQLAVVVERALGAAGADEDGRFPGLSEYVRAQIGLAAVDQPMHAETIVLEGFVVRSERQIVVDPAGHVAPMRRRQGALGGALRNP